MVKKNLVNKNVVRALSIGLSLAMASQPMMAMAAEGDNAEDNHVTAANDVESEVKDENKTGDVIDTAVNESAKTVAEVYTANVETGAKVDQAVNFASAKLAIDLNNDLNPFEIDAESQIDSLERRAERIADKEDELNDKADELDNKAEEANGYVDDADKAAEDASDILDTLESELDDAEDLFDEGRTELASATNQGAADAAYNKAAQAVDDANQAVETAQEEYNIAETAYNTAVENYDTAVEEWNVLKGKYDKALREYNLLKGSAQAKAGELSRELGILEKDLTKLAEEADKAEARAKSLKDEADAAKETAQNKLDELKESKYAELKAIEDDLKERLNNNNPDDNPKFGNADGESLEGTYDKYFNRIVELYYVPDVLNGTDAQITWNKFTDHQSNYATITYKDADGTEKTVLLNYKLNEKNDETKFGGLVIFEKTVNTVVTEEAYKAGDVDITDKIDQIGEDVLVDDENGLYIARAGEDSYVYAEGEGSTTEGQKADDEFLKDGQETTVSYEYDAETGKIRKVVTGDLYKMTFDSETATLDAEAKWTSREDAEAAYVAAIQELIDDLEDGESIVIGEGEDAVTYEKGDTATSVGFQVTGGEETSEEYQSGFDMKATYYKQYTEEIAGVYSKGTNWFWGYEEYYSSKRDAEAAGRNYWNRLSDREKQNLINEIIAQIGTQGYVESASFIDYEGAPARAVYNLNTAIPYSIDEVKIKAIEYDGGWAYELIVGKDCKFVECETLTRKRNETKEQFAERAKQAGYVLENNGNTAYYAPQKSTGSFAQTVVINDQAEIDRLNALISDGVSEDDALEFASAFNANALNAAAATEQEEGDYRKVEAFGAVVDPNSIVAHMATRSVVSPFGFAGISYTFNGAEYATLSRRDAVISTTEWDVEAVNKVAAKTETTYSNDNWYRKNVIFGTEYQNGDTPDYKTDERVNDGRQYTREQEEQTIDYRNKLDSTARDIKYWSNEIAKQTRASERQKKMIEYYHSISEQAKTAEKAVKDAEARVNYLKAQIDDLKYDRTLEEIKELESNLEEAEDRLQAAIERRDILQVALDELTIPTFPSGGTGEGGGETGGAGGDGGTTGTVVVPAADVLGTPVLTAGPLVFAPGAVVAPAAAEAAEGTTEIAEPETALAAAVPEETTEEPQLADLQNMETPLAAAPINEETLSWWWLLIIAVLGGAGYAMYKKYQTKKDEKTTN